MGKHITYKISNQGKVSFNNNNCILFVNFLFYRIGEERNRVKGRVAIGRGSYGGSDIFL